jgi:hypothetical protein
MPRRRYRPSSVADFAEVAFAEVAFAEVAFAEVAFAEVAFSVRQDTLDCHR